MVDNTFLSPVLQRPFELGADLVVHSTTKYLNGHSDVVGGAVVAARGQTALLQRIQSVNNLLGTSQSPHDAFLVLRGLKTLLLRMRAHEAGARAVAAFLAAHPPGGARSTTRGWRPTRSTRWPGASSTASAPCSASSSGPGAGSASTTCSGRCAGSRWRRASAGWRAWWPTRPP